MKPKDYEIPKTIHYCWFGRSEKSELIKKCIDSWKSLLSDYEIIEWNEDNFDLNKNRYAKEAYLSEKWAFVSDYVRMKILYEYGGIYLDTDMKTNRRFDDFHSYNTFLAFETHEDIHGGVIGCKAKSGLIKKLLDTYENDYFIKKDGCLRTDYTIVMRIKNVISNNYDIQFNGLEQILQGNIHIYPANVATINVYDGNSVFEHHYSSSWMDGKETISYKYIVLKDFFQYDPYEDCIQNKFKIDIRKNYFLRHVAYDLSILEFIRTKVKRYLKYISCKIKG